MTSPFSIIISYYLIMNAVSVFKLDVLNLLNNHNIFTFTHQLNNSHFFDKENIPNNLKANIICDLADEINLKGNIDIICKSSQLTNYDSCTTTISIKPNMKTNFLQVFAIINNELNFTEELSSLEVPSESVELIYVSDTTDSEEENHHFCYHYYSNETEEERRESRKSTKEISKYYFDLA